MQVIIGEPIHGAYLPYQLKLIQANKGKLIPVFKWGENGYYCFNGTPFFVIYKDDCTLYE